MSGVQLQDIFYAAIKYHEILSALDANLKPHIKISTLQANLSS